MHTYSLSYFQDQNLGLLTTPQLHHVVKFMNLRDENITLVGPEPEPGPGGAVEKANATEWASEAG